MEDTEKEKSVEKPEEIEEENISVKSEDDLTDLINSAIDKKMVELENSYKNAIQEEVTKQLKKKVVLAKKEEKAKEDERDKFVDDIFNKIKPNLFK